VSRADWKSYNRSTGGTGCACGANADLHVFFLPKVAIALIAVPAIAIAKGGGDLALVSLAGAGSLLAFIMAIYAHCLCVMCHKIARPDPGRERTTLRLIRIGGVIACVLLALATWRAAIALRSHAAGTALPVLTPAP
jgi:Na+/proline symporter